MNDIAWLLDEDPSVAYQAKRDLLGIPERELEADRRRIATRGWGETYLSRRRPDGHWGRDAYGPKWTCTHYVLADLKSLGIHPDTRECRESAELLLGFPEGKDGGVNYAKTVDTSDVCINGMLLAITSYFHVESDRVRAIVDYLLERRQKDGGWNCAYMYGSVATSFHTTIAVLEGLSEFRVFDPSWREKDVEAAIGFGIEWLLERRLFRSKRSGEVVDKAFLRFPYPIRWKYDALRCLDYLRSISYPYDRRMDEALDIVAARRGKDGHWKSERGQSGATYFETDGPDRSPAWNTLRGLRVLGKYKSGFE